MNEGIVLLFILVPILLIVGMYRLLAWLTSRRATRHGIKPPEESERKQQRIFFDE